MHIHHKLNADSCTVYESAFEMDGQTQVPGMLQKSVVAGLDWLGKHPATPYPSALGTTPLIHSTSSACYNSLGLALKPDSLLLEKIMEERR